MEFNSSQNICSSFLLKLPAVLNIETALTNKLDSLTDDQLKNTIEFHCTVHIKLTEQYQSALSDLAKKVEALADQSNINSKIKIKVRIRLRTTTCVLLQRCRREVHLRVLSPMQIFRRSSQKLCEIYNPHWWLRRHQYKDPYWLVLSIS